MLKVLPILTAKMFNDLINSQEKYKEHEFSLQLQLEIFFKTISFILIKVNFKIICIKWLECKLIFK